MSEALAQVGRCYRGLGAHSAAEATFAQALRWSSPTTALRYGRKLAVRSNVAARVLSRVRK